MSIFNNGGLVSSTIGNFFESAALMMEGAILSADEKASKIRYGTDELKLSKKDLEYWDKINAKLEGTWDCDYDCPKDSAIAKVAKLIDNFIILISVKDEERKLAILKELAGMDWDSISKDIGTIMKPEGVDDELIKIPINLSINGKNVSEEIELPQSKQLIGNKICELFETIEENSEIVKQDIDKYAGIARNYIDKNIVDEFISLFKDEKTSSSEEEEDGIDFAEAIRRSQDGLTKPLTPLVEPM